MKFAYVCKVLYLCIVKPCKSDMYKPSSNSRQASLFWDLETMLDSKHPLFKLANMVDWSLFEKSFAPLFCADNGRPPKPIRLMTGLLMLKHIRNYHCPVKLLKRKKLRADSNYGFSPNCYLCFRHKTNR